tara:strand:- start:1607 stop:1891 length:285 start_codon:yes stop_codon:yes gene_type:complete
MGAIMNADTLVKIGLWASAVLFGAGGIAAQMVGAHDMAADAAEKIERHADKPGHPVGLERIETVMTEQRALRDEVTAQGRSIAAICQATGARCD